MPARDLPDRPASEVCKASRALKVSPEKLAHRVLQGHLGTPVRRV